MICDTLRIASVNVRGLANYNKRRKMFHYFHQKELDMILLQETHSTKAMEKMWRSSWGGRISFAHGDSNARGVCILIRKKAPIKVLRNYTDSQGRMLIVDIEYQGLNISVCNIYAPNDDDVGFFTQVFAQLNNTGSFNRIIGGDFNLVLNPTIDKLGGREMTHGKCQKEVLSYMQASELLDIWRERNPEGRNYSWFRRNPKLIAERLDFFLISASLHNVVSNTEIIPSFCTDHSMVTITLQMSKLQRGSGFWKLNTSLLSDINYLEEIKEVISEVSNDTYKDNRTKWDFLKFKVKSSSIKYAARKHNDRKLTLQALERKLKTLQDKTYQDHSPFTELQNFNECENLRTEINKIMEYKTKGAIVRAKTDWFMYGEKSSSYFFKLENYKYTKKNRFKLMKKDGTITTDPSEILHEQYNFFKKIFSVPEGFEHDMSFVEGLKIPKIELEDKERLEQQIEYNEIIDALKTMEPDKVSGPDGLPVEFYKVFWLQIKGLVFEVIKEIATKGLTVDEGRGVISLMEKPNKNTLVLDSWRPLSMLNLDTKIYSKILANRLYTVTDKIIHHDQVGFQKNRYIGQNLMDLTTLIEYCDKKDLEALLISIDFYKAFDSVSWDAYYDILRLFGFGEQYIKFVKNLFTNISSCTMNSGVSSKWIQLQQGFRQGCCYSPPAFLLVVEILGLKIRANENILGVNCGHYIKKQAQFADDLWAILMAKQQSVDAFFNIIEGFAKCTGLRINYDKTQIMRLGSLKNSDAKLVTQETISWSRRVKILGIYFTPSKKEMIELNYNRLCEKIEQIVTAWSNRDLSLMGKILVVNSLIASQYTYYFMNTYSPTPEIIAKIKRLIKKYLWGVKPVKIAYNTLIQNRYVGGLQMVDPMSKNIALKVKWFKDAVGSQSASVMLADKFLPLPVVLLMECNIMPKDIIKNCPQSIWRDIWVTWAMATYSKEVDQGDSLTQIVWYNSHVKINGNVICYYDYIDKGIIYVRDLINPITNKVYTCEQFFNRYKLPKNFVKYMGLIDSLPLKWRKKLNCDQNRLEEIITAPLLNLNVQNFSRYVYWKVIDRIEYHDGTLTSWNHTLNLEIDKDKWQTARVLIFSNRFTYLTKLRYFQYKIFSRKLTTNYLRAKWDQNVSNVCYYCQDKAETINHLLIDCKIIRDQIWKPMFKWLSYMLETEIKQDPVSILFCMYKGKYGGVINLIMLITKYCIYATKCMEKEINFMKVIQEVYGYKDLEYIVATKLDKLKSLIKSGAN